MKKSAVVKETTMLVELNRASFIDRLGSLSNEELCSELRSRGIDDDRLLKMLDISMPEPEPLVPDPEGELSIEEASALYEAIAEGRTKDALEIIFSLYPSRLLSPNAQMRITSLRPAS